MSIPVKPTSKAMGDFANIAAHVKAYNDAVAARKIVKMLLDEAERLGEDRYHRLGEELDGYEGPPPREVHKWVCLHGRYELHYEVVPAYADVPTLIALLRVWDARQDR
jgi:hypothetical protein